MFTEVSSVANIEIAIIKLKDVDEELIISQVGVYPGVGIFYLVTLLLGRNYGSRFQRSNRTPEITIWALGIHNLLEMPALRALVDMALLPGLVVFSTKEIIVWDLFFTVPIPADIPVFSPQHGFIIS